MIETTIVWLVLHSPLFHPTLLITWERGSTAHHHHSPPTSALRRSSHQHQRYPAAALSLCSAVCSRSSTHLLPCDCSPSSRFPVSMMPLNPCADLLGVGAAPARRASAARERRLRACAHRSPVQKLHHRRTNRRPPSSATSAGVTRASCCPCYRSRAGRGQRLQPRIVRDQVGAPQAVERPRTPHGTQRPM